MTINYQYVITWPEVLLWQRPGHMMTTNTVLHDGRKGMTCQPPANSSTFGRTTNAASNSKSPLFSPSLSFSAAAGDATTHTPFHMILYTITDGPTIWHEDTSSVPPHSSLRDHLAIPDHSHYHFTSHSWVKNSGIHISLELFAHKSYLLPNPCT